MQSRTGVPGSCGGGHRRDADVAPKGPSWSRFGAPTDDLEPIVAEAQIADVERDELGTAPAAGEAQAQQGSIPGVTRIVLRIGLHERGQGQGRQVEHDGAGPGAGIASSPCSRHQENSTKSLV
jgi:hypothetical protein